MKIIKILILIQIFIFYSCSNKTILIKDTKVDNLFIIKDTVWDGNIEVNGNITVMKGITLTILPGTIVKFIPLKTKSSNPHEETNGIIIEGKLKAVGTKDKRIFFTSSSNTPSPGDWGKILFKYSKDNIIKYCDFMYAEYAIHAHFSTGSISFSEFKNNTEGMRLGMSSFVIKNNNFINNVSRGINFKQSSNIIEFNNIYNNAVGIFLYEKNSNAKIINNNIYNNTNFNIQLGEFYTEDIIIEKNWYGTTDMNEINKLIYDKSDNPGIGKITTSPILSIINDAGF